VRELRWRYSSLIAVRLPICVGIDPVSHMKKCRRRVKSTINVRV
jgi:hypothetical protein